ncbi:MAG: cell division/cell wall cluster transcriptional repressor MraZ [Chloroflexota bacterium]|nr:cell division/cell wall cluster transcriptional repressor MraZ [Chloroflexota bacterium]
MYLYGTFEHSMDDRGRVAVPAVFRRELLDGGVLRPAEDGCLELYTQQGFESETAQRLGESGTQRRGDRRRRRLFLPDALHVDLDRQGRIVIPQEMRERAGLEGRASLVGLGDYIEIWNPDRWAEERAAAEAQSEDDA